MVLWVSDGIVGIKWYYGCQMVIECQMVVRVSDGSWVSEVLC